MMKVLIRPISRSRMRGYKLLATRFALSAAIVCGVFDGVAEARRHEPSTGLAKIAFDKPAPNFAFETGTVPASLAALRGKPIVLNFWATYCEPCTGELDAFARLHKTYGDGVALVTVSDQTRDIVDAMLHERGVDAISVVDPDRKIFDLYGVMPIPVTLVIAPDGSVRHVSIGELDWAELQAAVGAVRPEPAAVRASPAS